MCFCQPTAKEDWLCHTTQRIGAIRQGTTIMLCAHSMRYDAEQPNKYSRCICHSSMQIRKPPYLVHHGVLYSPALVLIVLAWFGHAVEAAGLRWALSAALLLEQGLVLTHDTNSSRSIGGCTLQVCQCRHGAHTVCTEQLVLGCSWTSCNVWILSNRRISVVCCSVTDCSTLQLVSGSCTAAGVEKGKVAVLLCHHDSKLWVLAHPTSTVVAHTIAGLPSKHDVCVQ